MADTPLLGGVVRVVVDRHEATVTYKMPVKEWSKLKRLGALGQLYGIDISNAVHRMDTRIRAYHPVVSDRERAEAGIKTIKLRYQLKPVNRPRLV